jgi:hypothetical protein
MTTKLRFNIFKFSWINNVVKIKSASSNDKSQWKGQIIRLSYPDFHYKYTWKLPGYVSIGRIQGTHNLIGSRGW